MYDTLFKRRLSNSKKHCERCYAYAWRNKRTECEPLQFGSSRDHIAAATAASKGPPTVFVWVLNMYLLWTGMKVFLNFRVWPWPWTFRGQLRSKIFSPFESPYMTSYLTSIDIFSLSHTVFEIFDFNYDDGNPNVNPTSADTEILRNNILTLF